SLLCMLIASILFLVFGMRSSSTKISLTKETLFIGISPLLLIFLVMNVNRVQKNSMNSISDIIIPKTADYFAGKKFTEAATLSQQETATIDVQLGSQISSGRFALWGIALENFKKSPLLGIGFGNYKAAGKEEYHKYLKKPTGAFSNPRRAHSDFLEKLAETGILGFLLYVSLFILPFIWFVKLIRKEKNYQTQWMYVTIFLVATAYTFDALLNFPLERPPLQFYFIAAVAFIIAFAENKHTEKVNTSKNMRNVFLFGVFLCFSLASTASNYLTFDSYQLQRNLRTDLMGKTLFTDEKLQNNFEEVQRQWSNYPQLSYVGTANNVFLANYAIKAKKYDEALEILNTSESYNANGLLVKALKAEIFLNIKDNLDSARYYSEKVFNIYPAFKTNYKMLKKIYAAQKDTANVIRTMHRYTRYNYKDINEWKAKANFMYQHTKDSDLMLKVLDTGIAYNTYSKKLVDAKKEILTKVKFKSYLSKEEVKAKHQEAYDFFVKQQYTAARNVYEGILKTNPKDFLSIQNIGIIDLIQKNYKAAITNLSRVIKAGAFNDGKAEYSRGYCYEQLGQLEKAKEDYRASRAKNYPQAISLPPSKYE
ncbi:MAG: O-antigen ligase family protein, partial [Bacteroidota bacterium]